MRRRMQKRIPLPASRDIRVLMPDYHHDSATHILHLGHGTKHVRRQLPPGAGMREDRPVSVRMQPSLNDNNHCNLKAAMLLQRQLWRMQGDMPPGADMQRSIPLPMLVRNTYNAA